MSAVPPAPSGAWAYFFDLDGTLSPLAAAPASARVSETLLKALRALRAAADGALAIISGRPIVEVDAMLGEPRLPVAGQHGAERRDAAGMVNTVPLAMRASLVTARDAIARSIAERRGLLLEDKGMSLALHYRQAPGQVRFAHQLMRTQCRLLGPAYGVLFGKRVVEVRPLAADKGSAVRAFLEEPPFAARRPVFVGDDVSDEFGFREVLARDGIAIKVGPGRSVAPYRLRGVREVEAWMRGITPDREEVLTP